MKKIAVYSREGRLPDQRSLHLAIEKKEKFEELNFGIGVLFAEASWEQDVCAGLTRVLDRPVLYRRSNHLFGVIADCTCIQRKKEAWEDLPETTRKAAWISRNLVEYEGLSLEEAKKELKEYEKVYEEGISSLVEIAINGETVLASCLEINDREAEYLEKKLGPVYHTGMEPLTLHIPLGETINHLPGVKATYSDGSTRVLPVQWEESQLKAISFEKEGIYQVHGKVCVSEYPEPIVEGVADPYVLRYEGKYYLIGTNEFSGGRDLLIREAATIERLADAVPVTIFQATEQGEHSGCNWAPELHLIGNRLCCLFASSLDGTWKQVQSRILFCDGNPAKKESWSEPVRITKADGTFLITDGITLDMTYFEAAGKSYYCWAQRNITTEGIDSSDLFLAQIDPLHPQRLLSEPVCLLKPKFAWDRQHTEVDEGPNVLKKDGKLFLTFSGDSVSDYYCMGLLTAKEDADLLNPGSWKETGYPVLGREHVETQRGPGHNSFGKDEFGRDLLIYHAKPNGGTRSFFARVIHYGFDGTPLFYLTEEAYCKREYREVVATVMVEKPAYLFVHFRETTTPDGEQVYFGLSQDGFHWEAVSDGKPLLWAYYGDKGVRDFTITRCENNGKYYIFATDLSLAYGMRGKYHHSWAEVGRNGSKFLAMWESDDLVHWKEQKLIPFGGEELGCRWAPDILHDKKTGEYIIHWSSPHESDGYKEKAIFYSRTRDFEKFTEPEVLYRKEDSGVIDSALYEEAGSYYLFVKSEKNPCGVILLEAKQLTGPYKKVEGFEESMNLKTPHAYEAPTAVRLEDGRWCLFLDYFGVKGKGQGYVPFLADKIAEGKFVRSDDSFGFPYGFKHGTILKITISDYERIKSFDWSEPEDLR